MNHTDYSSIVAAFRTHNQQLIILDDKGKRHVHPEKNPLEQENILEQMNLQGNFATFEMDWVFNPQHVTEARYDYKNKTIMLCRGDQVWMHGPKIEFEFAEPKLHNLERSGFAPWPGDRMFNNEFIEEMFYEERLRSLVMRDCHGKFYEAGINFYAAQGYLDAFERIQPQSLSTSIQPATPQAEQEQTKPAQAAEQEPPIDKEALRMLPVFLKSAVIGQDPAADALTEAIYRHKAKLGDENKPVGSFLFTGPTGVGKTETARQLAKVLGLDFLKLDMSEYQEKHSSSRMIGSPPGYVGYSSGGQLTSRVQEKKRCLVLLDEIEKAHPDVTKLLLQAFDDACMTDGQGNTVDFSQVIFIMTSNLTAGPQAAKKNGIGFTAAASPEEDKASSDPRKNSALRAYFVTELMNRIDSVVEFQSLKPEHMEDITRLVLQKLVKKEGMKNINFSITREAQSYLAREGYDEEFGARPLKRLIADRIETRLARELLFGELENGGSVQVGLSEDKSRLNFTFNAAANDNKVEALPAPAAVPCLPAPAVS